MRLKQLPRRHLAKMDLQFDRWPPKTPPLELGGGHVEHPIGFEPGGDIIVACDSNEPARQMSAADTFGDRGGAHFGDIAIDDAGELVEDDEGLSARCDRWRTPGRAGG